MSMKYREFRASFNLITQLPQGIGKLKHLRILILNGNRLEHLCDEICLLTSLQELNLSENKLIELPNNILQLINLKSLKLQANLLQSLPLVLSVMGNLDEIDCTNNPLLTMIPEIWRSDTNSIKAACSLHREYVSALDELSLSNDELISQNQFLQYNHYKMKVPCPLYPTSYTPLHAYLIHHVYLIYIYAIIYYIGGI